MNDQFEGNDSLDSFINWKRLKGYEVDVVKTSEIDSSGPDSAQIVAYMRDTLSSNEYPTFLLIMHE